MRVRIFLLVYSIATTTNAVLCDMYTHTTISENVLGKKQSLNSLVTDWWKQKNYFVSVGIVLYCVHAVFILK
jgi:hypothetical protein